MHLSHASRAAVAVAVAISFAALIPAHADSPGGSLGRTLSTLDRMKEQHLKAATEDVARIKASRQPVALQSGLNDFRSILHAHAEDSSHTGGTRPEMLADAKKADVKVIMLTNHFRPPLDFITQTWRGIHDGVLFIPGSETHGFLVYPVNSVMDKMDLEGPPFISAITEGEGLIFLSHIEARFQHPMDGLTGLEIYNRHADAMDDIFALASLVQVMVDPKRHAEFQKLLETYPDAMFASQLDYPQLYMTKWDKETKERRLTGVAANDCHHNMVMITKLLDAENVGVGTIVDPDDGLRKISIASTPTLAEMVKDKKPGDILVTLDFDPYYRSFWNESTHILSPEQTEEAIRASLKAGHCYVSHDWMCDPTGFLFAARNEGEEKNAAIMGDEIAHTPTLRLVAEFPVECDARLLKDGEEIAKSHGRTFAHTPDGPGVYRLEGFLKVDGEDRIWIYSNPIYIRNR